MKYLLSVSTILLLFLFEPSFAGIELPSFANEGNMESDLNSTGKKVIDILSVIVAVLSLVSMFVGAGFFALGKQEEGKKFLFGGIIALILAGSAYGIAGLFIK